MVLLSNQLPHLIALLEQFSFLLLEVRAQTTTLTFEGVRLPADRSVVGFRYARVDLSAKLFNTLTHQLVLPLECIVFSAHHTLIVRVSTGHIASMVQPLVQAANSVLLRLNLATVVGHHHVALVLEALILRLGLEKLTLELFEFLLVSGARSERLSQVSPDRLTSTVLES